MGKLINKSKKLRKLGEEIRKILLSENDEVFYLINLNGIIKDLSSNGLKDCVEILENRVKQKEKK